MYFNTWRTSVLSVPESDPIDIAVNEPKLATLYVAGALDEQLIVSSEQAQFVLDGSPVTPQSALLNKISSFRISNVRPVLSGKSLIFSSFGAEYAGAQDFFRTQSGAFSAEKLASQCLSTWRAPLPLRRAIQKSRWLSFGLHLQTLSFVTNTHGLGIAVCRQLGASGCLVPRQALNTLTS